MRAKNPQQAPMVMMFLRLVKLPSSLKRRPPTDLLAESEILLVSSVATALS